METARPTAPLPLPSPSPGSGSGMAPTLTLMDLDAVPGHVVGKAIWSSNAEGPILSDLSEHEVNVMYRILLEVGSTLVATNTETETDVDTEPEPERLRRVTVGFEKFRYTMAIGADGSIYMVKTESR
eukprot:scaffold101679_cov64-Attheya_sp.AAC.3